MKLQAIVSSVALAVALSFSGAAVAQDRMIGDTVIPADQFEQFNYACEALQAKTLASATTDDDLTSNDEDLTTGSTNDPDGPSDSADPAAQDNWDELIAGLTMEDCETNNFFKVD